MQQTKNRWLIVLAAIGIHISIGSVYAWSVLTKPIMQAMVFSLKEVTWTFSLAILFLGTSAGFLGTYVEKYGPRRSGLISMCFFVSGLLGTAYALTQHSLLLLYLLLQHSPPSSPAQAVSVWEQAILPRCLHW